MEHAEGGEERCVEERDPDTQLACELVLDVVEHLLVVGRREQRGRAARQYRSTCTVWFVDFT